MGVLLFSTFLVTGCARPSESRPYVHRLEIRGVHNVSRHKLEHGLASRPTPWWKIGASHHLFDELELARDRVRVQRFYERNGYYAAKVVLAEAMKKNHGAAVDVVIAVEEGAPTIIGDVKVFGIDGLDKTTREKIQQYQLGLRRGQVFHHADYVEFKGDLLRVLKKRGYESGTFEGVIDVSPTTNKAIITLTFHKEGKDEPNAPVAPAAPVAIPQSAGGDAAREQS